ncbi:CDP-diacylglycerol--glycerol-3-phosphate 3-phosphatidyltransferase [Desulfuromusa kysingii]|uniref:CDP-diacylglycerol--glycerol-3-phosphate 3-phosphatidyltransferase n=1 Tax=Desulfuromusa kysingii TaxID=37625 RepID=A0A1H4BCS0_9BACT|nr:CDP-diacylglycerol--glycerol-3-phosphate 3-phosphatidyltransferase [Desulfuromusa kysingii]SEA45906.1 CDP-diacylglycerol--glycerol-3-phosphate 3-phosphatidyltransferase [Desulfuromusa kysingii]
MTSETKLLNLPNILTLSRIAAVPLVVFLLLFESKQNCFWAAFVFTAASITDWLDGYLARKWHIVTILGKFLDPLADKLIVMAALIMLIPLDRVPAWAVFVILARELIVSGIRSIASSEGIVIAASDLGKYKTIFQMIAIVGLLLHYRYYWFFGVQFDFLYPSLHNAGIFIFYISLFLTVWSGGDYFVKFFKLFAKK